MAIDPGNEQSAYVICDDYAIIKFGKVNNRELLEEIDINHKEFEEAAIERVQCLGMAVGATVFETCEWVGRYTQLLEMCGIKAEYVYRSEEKIDICGNKQAKDGNIRQALISRFAKTANGKGTIKAPDFFYGFSQDVWSAYAVLVTYLDREKERTK
jgi:hypothetical protein